MNMSTRKNLIILRAGDGSLHTTWFGKGERNWDLALSYFGDKPDPYPGYRDYLHPFKGSKWEGIADFVARNEGLLARYERIWLPDDDLFTNQETINLLFNKSDEYGFDISQPALKFYSFVSHAITMQHPWCDARETNFVEIMAPSFSRRAWAAVKDTFSENTSGWGLEWLWVKRIQAQAMHLGVVDGAAIFHTRPVGVAGHGGANAPAKEMFAVFEKYGIKMAPKRTLKYFGARIPGSLCPQIVLWALNFVMHKLFR